MGALAELLAASMNTNTGGIDYHSANYVEKQVIDWFKEIMSFPPEASGLLTSGCSAANLIGLAVARNTQARFDLRSEGVLQSPGRRLVLYASQEIHSSVQKAVELLGLGGEALRLVPVDDISRSTWRCCGRPSLRTARRAISRSVPSGQRGRPTPGPSTTWRQWPMSAGVKVCGRGL